MHFGNPRSGSDTSGNSCFAAGDLRKESFAVRGGGHFGNRAYRHPSSAPERGI